MDTASPTLLNFANVQDPFDRSSQDFGAEFIAPIHVRFAVDSTVYVSLEFAPSPIIK
jgi:hypothetical protein